MRAGFCLIWAALLLVNEVRAQNQEDSGKQKVVVDATGADASGPTSDPVRVVNSALIDRISSQIRSADYMEDSGDAARSLQELSQAYAQAMQVVQSTPTGTQEFFEAVRQAEGAGRRYAWSLADDQQLDAAERIYRDLMAVLEPYDVVKPPPALVSPISGTYWLGARLASDRGDADLDRRLKERAGALTEDFDVYDGDYVTLARRRASFLRYGTDLDPEIWKKRKEEACNLVIDIEKVRPDTRSLMDLVQCDIDKFWNLRKEKKFVEARQQLDFARGRIQEKIDAEGEFTPIAARFLLVDVELALKALAGAMDNDEEFARRQLTATDLLVASLKGRAYAQKNTREIINVYAEIRDVDFSQLPELKSKADRDAANMAHNLRIADAVETSRKAFPKLVGYAVAYGESLARVATLQLDAGNQSEADANSAHAERAMDDANLIAGLREMDEIAESECLARNRRVRVLIALDRTDDALAAFRKFDETCGDWVRKYPWEFYARVYATEINTRLGNHLRLKGRVADALPLLTYASNWGVKEASEGLAAVYGDPASPLADLEKAKRVGALAMGQNMKRFTVPTDFGGKKYPFHVYVVDHGDGPLCKSQAEPLDPTEPCVGYAGIDDQVLWVRELRGGKIPDDVVDSFQKLYTIAKENNVSFTELTVYALGAATKPDIATTDGQIETIYDEMKAKKFARSPDRWLDPAGIALGGYDAVSYRQGSTPVLGSAEFYTFWDGALWLFKDAANRDLFSSDPDRFAPQYGGFSAWEVIDRGANAGDPAIFALVEDKLFMFDEEKHIADWKIDAMSKIAKADEAWFGMEPTGTAAATKLADRILKLGPVQLADRTALYVEGCQQNRGDQCDRLFRLARKQCIQNDSIPACNLAIAFAEGMKSKSVLVSLLGSRSWKYAQANKPDQAITDAERALAIDPNQPWIHGNLANGLLMKGQVDRALAIYREQQDKPGPGQEGTMCKFILEDVDTMLAAKVLGEEAAAEVRRAIVCP